MKPIYLDYAATTPVDPRVVEAMSPYWTDIFGNSSSIHHFGETANKAIEKARKQVAALIGSRKKEIIFTGSGTEANNTVFKGICHALKSKGNHIIVSPIEHPAVLNPAKYMKDFGFDVTILPVNSDGIVDPEDVKSAIRKETILISVMHANNEIGTIQPVEAIAHIAHEYQTLFHTDAVQTVGHLPINVDKMGIDLLSLSAHKFYGPKGVGALYVKKDIPYQSLLHGGSHENKRRASTLNTPGIVGLGKAAEIAQNEMQREADKITDLRDNFWQQIQNNITGISFNGDKDNRLPNNLNIAIEHVEGESVLMRLDLNGIGVSSGSACSSGSGKVSHVLTAIGLSAEQARGSIRFSLGRKTTREEINQTVTVLKNTVEQLRSLSTLG